MDIQNKENRRFHRTKIKAALRFQVRGQPGFNNCVSDDISLGGVKLLNRDFVPPGTPVGLEIIILSRRISSIGKIIWSHSIPRTNNYLIGIEFLEMDLKQRNYLNEFISARNQIKTTEV